MLENKQQKTFSKKPSCFKGVIRNLNGHFRYPTNHSGKRRGEEKLIMEKKCQKCRYYSAYYEKGLANFSEREKRGYVVKSKKPWRKTVAANYIYLVFIRKKRLPWNISTR